MPLDPPGRKAERNTYTKGRTTQQRGRTERSSSPVKPKKPTQEVKNKGLQPKVLMDALNTKINTIKPKNLGGAGSAHKALFTSLSALKEEMDFSYSEVELKNNQYLYSNDFKDQIITLLKRIPDDVDKSPKGVIENIKTKTEEIIAQLKQSNASHSGLVKNEHSADTKGITSKENIEAQQKRAEAQDTLKIMINLHFPDGVKKKEALGLISDLSAKEANDVRQNIAINVKEFKKYKTQVASKSKDDLKTDLKKHSDNVSFLNDLYNSNDNGQKLSGLVGLNTEFKYISQIKEELAKRGDTKKVVEEKLSSKKIVLGKMQKPTEGILKTLHDSMLDRFNNLSSKINNMYKLIDTDPEFKKKNEEYLKSDEFKKAISDALDNISTEPTKDSYKKSVHSIDAFIAATHQKIGAEFTRKYRDI